MRTITAISTTGIALCLLMLFSSSVDARRGGGGFSGGGGGRSIGPSAPRMSHPGPSAPRSLTQSSQRARNTSNSNKVHRQEQHKRTAAGKAAKSGNKNANAARNQVQHKRIGADQKSGSRALQPGQAIGKNALRNLPVSKAVAGTALTRGRVAVPKNLRPRVTLTRAPAIALRPRLLPFVQRHWRNPFFWATVAGIGYLTIPELYYDRFYSCVNVVDPDYECAVDVLSAAALNEDKETARVRAPMPPDATFKYTANVAPKVEPNACTFDPFVERQWNLAFVWVQIPQVGNVTVPEDYYDRFFADINKDPPDYAAACKVLAEALAGDTVAASTAEIGQTL
jgi:hypothetical protein